MNFNFKLIFTLIYVNLKYTFKVHEAQIRDDVILFIISIKSIDARFLHRYLSYYVWDAVTITARVFSIIIASPNAEGKKIMNEHRHAQRDDSLPVSTPVALPLFLPCRVFIYISSGCISYTHDVRRQNTCATAKSLYIIFSALQI